MTTIILNKFDGGHAEDKRTHTTDECESCDNFDIFSTPSTLKPYIDLVAETLNSGVITDYKLTDIDVIPYAGSPTLVALGNKSSIDTSPTFFVKNSNSDITSPFVLKASGTAGKVAGTLVIFRNNAYCLSDNTTQFLLQEYDGNVTVTSRGAIGGYSSFPAKPYVHPEDQMLYIGAGNIISRWDDSSMITSAFVLPVDKVIVSLTHYGTYLVIVCRPKNGIGNSTMYFWGRDTSITTIQESIDLGACQVNIVENIDNQLYVITSENLVGNYSTIFSNKLTAKVYTGGALQIVKELTLSSSFGTSLNIIKVLKNSKLYFGFSNDTSIYVFGKNKSGRYFLSHNRALPTATSSLTNFNLVGDFLFVAFDTQAQSSQLKRTLSLSETQSYNTTSTYKTTINPNMPLGDRSVRKQLEAIQVMITSVRNAGSTSIKYSVDGGAVETIATLSHTAGELVLEATKDSNGDQLDAGREYQFQIDTTGGQIKDIRYRYQTLEQLV